MLILDVTLLHHALRDLLEMTWYASLHTRAGSVKVVGFADRYLLYPRSMADMLLIYSSIGKRLLWARCV